MFKKKSKVYDEAIAKCFKADGKDLEWDAVMEMGAAINEHQGGAKEALSSLKRLVKSKDENEALQALLLLDSLMNYTDWRFQTAVATKKWTERLVEITRSHPATVVREKVLELLVNWRHMFQGDPDMQAFQHACAYLEQFEKIQLPQPTTNTVMPSRRAQEISSSPSKVLDDMAMKGGTSNMAERRASQQRRLSTGPRLAGWLDSIKLKMSVLKDSLESAENPEENRNTLEAVAFLKKELPKLQMHIGQEGDNAEIMSDLIETNDVLVTLLDTWDEVFPGVSLEEFASTSSPPLPRKSVQSDDDVPLEDHRASKQFSAEEQQQLQQQHQQQQSGSDGFMSQPPQEQFNPFAATSDGGNGPSGSGGDAKVPGPYGSQMTQPQIEEMAKLKEQNEKLQDMLRQLQSSSASQPTVAPLPATDGSDGASNQEVQYLQQRVEELEKEQEAMLTEASDTFEKREKELVAQLESLKVSHAQELRAEKDRTAALESQTSSDSQEQAQVAEALRKAQEDLAVSKQQLAEVAGERDDLQQQVQTLTEENSAIRESANASSVQTNNIINSCRNIQSQFALAKESKGELHKCITAFNDQVARDMKKLSTKLVAGCIDKAKAMAMGSVQAMKDDRDKYLRLYKAELKQRRKLHNEIQELKGNIRVFARVRPMLGDEVGANVDVTEFPDDYSVVIKDNSGISADKKFEFDQVYSPNSTQPQVFEETVPLIQSMMDGYNVCLFAYGQTGSGKTHTMVGAEGNEGILYRAIDTLFSKKEELEAGVDGENPMEVKLYFSMYEIYNETIRDLLQQEELENAKYEVKKDDVMGMFVPGAEMPEVFNRDEVKQLINKGNDNRSVGVTKMNEHSSRSHMLICFMANVENKLTKEKFFGKLTLCDLAGSERIAKSEATGMRLKEAQHINKSLSALGDVMASLASGQKHTPYRNSKLTYLLQDSIGGHSKVLMFVNCAPLEAHTSETLSSLNFALRAKSVELGKAEKKVRK